MRQDEESRWAGRGLIPGTVAPWAAHSALQPTPLKLDGGRLRVFAGMRDEEGRSRVGFVDLDCRPEPVRVLHVSGRPSLGVGARGAFDADGVVPCAVAPRGDGLYLYYAGYRRSPEPGVRFTVFSGLAVSDDGGESFARRGIVLPPSSAERLFRVLHSTLFEGGCWRAWYGAGSFFRPSASGYPLPVYDIRHTQSPDGASFPGEGVTVLPLGAGEYRVGRPYVVREGPGYEMFFGASTEADPYRLRRAVSADGLSWERVPLAVEGGEWDSGMSAYPAVVRVAGRRLMFYNGNEYGRCGFGYAEAVN